VQSLCRIFSYCFGSWFFQFQELGRLYFHLENIYIFYIKKFYIHLHFVYFQGQILNYHLPYYLFLLSLPTFILNVSECKFFNVKNMYFFQNRLLLFFFLELLILCSSPLLLHRLL
jgi:hypothetical protein